MKKTLKIDPKWDCETSLPVKQYRLYRQRVFRGAEIGKDQDREMALAFYAGMAEALNTISVLSDTAANEDEGAYLIERWREDLTQAALHTNLERATGLS